MPLSRDQIITQGIVLRRTNFREADRILTFLTPTHGKVSVIAKGVRRQRSKLAGGVELLSVSDIAVLPGRGDLGTLTSARLVEHYGNIVQDIGRTTLAYDLLKRVNRLTEDAAGEEYFLILQRGLAGLNDASLPSDLCELWFTVQLMDVSGQLPDLQADINGQKLTAATRYGFDLAHMAFDARPDASFGANHIKLLRLCYGTDNPLRLKNIVVDALPLAETLALAKNIQLQAS
jgi:DNA repair protein RecO